MPATHHAPADAQRANVARPLDADGDTADPGKAITIRGLGRLVYEFDVERTYGMH